MEICCFSLKTFKILLTIIHFVFRSRLIIIQVSKHMECIEKKINGKLQEYKFKVLFLQEFKINSKL